jgi:hypothetical protein
MFALIKAMGHERYMVLLVGFFYSSDHFDQVLSHTLNQKGNFF